MGYADKDLEEPAYLGRMDPREPRRAAARGHLHPLNYVALLDALESDLQRDRTLGYLVMVDVIFVIAAGAMAGEGLWLIAAVLAVAAGVAVYGTVRRARRRVQEEMDAPATLGLR